MPQRPRDIQLTNIIDKLAEFVARNGSEFEKMTKIKQQNNSKFAFLSPGSEFFQYYQYKVMEERRNLIGKRRKLVNFEDSNLVSIQECPINLKTSYSNASNKISGRPRNLRMQSTIQHKSITSMPNS